MEELLIETRFTLEARVGRGATGEVFRARDRLTGQLVAVKRLDLDPDEAQTVGRFRREARILARVEHPHVVRYVAHGLDAEGRACVVVEWLEGEDLAHRQKRAPLTGAEAIAVAMQVAAGLAALHAAGIIHRDVKPANVFLLGGSERGISVKLIDLGLARAAGESRLSATGQVVGTPAYMSPEQARGDAELTPAADQFGLGVLLFELLAGQKPFAAPSSFAVLAKILLAEPPRLREIAPHAPKELDALLHRALRKDPAQRFPSMDALAAALAAAPAWVERAAEVAPPPSLSPASVERERRVVTALFAGLPAGGEADARAVAAIVEERGGICHGDLGHRVMAVFGAARTDGDEAVRAAAAALALTARFPAVRASIATGRAQGELPAELIERGVALLDAATRGVLVDDVTARLVADAFVAEGGLLRGLRAGWPAARAPAPLVGRDRELATLAAAADDCLITWTARAVAIVGPPGIGKSRLRGALLEHVTGVAPDAVVMGARGSPLLAHAAFALIARLLRRAAGIVEGDAPDVQRDKLAARTAAAGAPAELLEELAGLPPRGGGARDSGDAVLIADRLRSAFVGWLAAEVAKHPVVLVIEDLHWGDLPSVSFLGAGLRALAGRPFLLVAVGRSEIWERFPGTWISGCDPTIPLGPLRPRDAAHLARAAGGGALTEAEVERVVASGEGNPFYLEELARAAIAGPADHLPDTVLGAVQARLDALGPAAKAALRAASVRGISFRPSDVAALLGERDVDAVIERLVAAGLISPSGAADAGEEGAFIFRQALVRDAAYAMIPDDDRRDLHVRAAEHLLAEGTAEPAAVAAHFEAGGELRRALAHHLAAAEAALAGNDFAAAVDHAGRALDAGASGESRGRCRLIQAEAHRWRGELHQAALAAAAAADSLPKRSPRWFHALREAIAANGRLGRVAMVQRWAEAALRSPSADPGPRLAALAPAAGQMIYAGDLQGAAAMLAEIDRVVAPAARLDPSVSARIHQARAIHADHLRDPEAALAHHEAALRCFELAGDARAACLTRANIGFLAASLGALAEGEASLRVAHATAARMGLGTITPLALHMLGGVLLCRGALAEARAAEEEAAAAFALAGDPRLEAASRVFLARVHLASGAVAEALDEARRATEAAAAPPSTRAAARAVEARALLSMGRVPEALERAVEAASLLASLGAVEDCEVLIGVTLVEARRAAGHREAARAAAAEAARRLLDRAARLTEPTRGRFLGAVPDNVRCLALARELGALPA